MKKIITFIIFVLIIFQFSPLNRAAKAYSPPVLAFYYAWFDDNTWVSGQSAGNPAPAYRSTDPATIERHVTQASNAGINAFVQSWYGPQEENNQTETNFRLLLDTAARYQFQAAVDVEVRGPFFPDQASVQSALVSLLATHINHPAYLRFNGQPVIFFWRQQRFSVDQWRAIRQAVDPDHNTLWIAEGVDLAYLDVFDGHHLYSIAWSGNPTAELNKWPPRIERVETQLGANRLWVATAMPGYNDLNLNRGNSFARDREGGEFYRRTWAAAINSQPDMLIITSFNEWLEGTQIEPGEGYGDFYLNLTRELANSVSASPSVVSTDDSLAAPEPEPTPEEIAPEENTSPQPVIVPEDGLYTVQPGDTLFGIAFALGLDPDDLIADNNMASPDQLSVGQTLVVVAGAAEPSEPTPSKFNVTPFRSWKYQLLESVMAD